MACVEDVFLSLTIVSIVLTIWFFLIMLPDNSYVVKTLFSLLLTVVIMGILSNVSSTLFSDSDLILFLTYVGVFVSLVVISIYLSQLFTVISSLLLIGPVFAATQDNLNKFSTDISGSELPSIGLIVAIVIIAVVVFSLYAWFRNSSWFLMAMKTFTFSLLFAFSVQLLWIKSDQSVDKFCCDLDDFGTCPVYGRWSVFFVFAAAFLTRLFLEWRWKSYGDWFYWHWVDRERDKKKKEKEKMKKELLNLDKKSGKHRRNKSESDKEDQPLLEADGEDLESALNHKKPKSKKKKSDRSKSRNRS